VKDLKVLVAEDSSTTRRLLVEILESSPGLQVVGEARTGKEAVALTHRLSPDVITLDIRMPEMDGLDATKRIMTECPTPIVIISSAVNLRDAEVSAHALRLGALWVLPKPSGPLDPGFSAAVRDIIDIVKAMAAVKLVKRRGIAVPTQFTTRSRPRTVKLAASRRPVRAVAIAASTGGPGAVSELLSRLSVPFTAPVFLVQHITAGFVHSLATSLNNSSYLHVKVAEQNETPSAGIVYLAPDGLHMELADAKTIRVHDGEPVGGFRPAANRLFHSIADVFGNESLGVILTGMGQDGTDGLQAIHHAHGHVIAQDEGSSVVFGMPKAAIDAGVVNEILDVKEIAGRVNDLVTNGYRKSEATGR